MTIGNNDDKPPKIDNIIPVQLNMDMKLLTLNPKAYFGNFKSLISIVLNSGFFSVEETLEKLF